jgi:hypothetical protein
MKETPRRRFGARPLCALIRSLLLTSIVVNLAASNSFAQSRPPTLILSVSSESGEASLDAIGFLDGKTLRAPYTDDEKDHQKFGNEYFAAGKVYRLIFGGGEAGTVTVNKWGVGCETLHAQGTLKTAVRVGGKVMALATNSETLGKRPPSRRAPTEAERAAVITLMKSIYSQHRTPANLISSIKVSNLTATDLNGDGKYEVIGSFALTAKNKFERDLFLVTTPQGAAMRADFVKFQAYQPPPEGFLSSVDYIDQLDIDGDGVAEVFATAGGFDGYELLVFKKVNGRWRQIYDMAGDAC